MKNRSWSACLLLAGLVWTPSGAAAQEVSVTIGDVTPARETEGDCPAYISSGRDDAPFSGALHYEEERRTTTTSTVSGGVSGSAVVVSGSTNGSVSTSEETTYSVGYYDIGEDRMQRFDCRTMRPKL